MYRTDFDTINVKTRNIELVEVRQAICYFVKKENPYMRLSKIGEIFTPPRNHATVIYSIKTYEDLIFSNSRVKNISANINAKLNFNHQIDYDELIKEYERFV
jgi:chromosomal replication initiation ATPase DnaA